MEVAQNEVYLKRGDLGDILKAFGLGCTLQERKQRLRAKTFCGRHPLKNAMEYHGVLFAVCFLIGPMSIYFLGCRFPHRFFLKCDGFNKLFSQCFLKE